MLVLFFTNDSYFSKQSNNQISMEIQRKTFRVITNDFFRSTRRNEFFLSIKFMKWSATRWFNLLQLNKKNTMYARKKREENHRPERKTCSRYLTYIHMHLNFSKYFNELCGVYHFFIYIWDFSRFSFLRRKIEINVTRNELNLHIKSETDTENSWLVQIPFYGNAACFYSWPSYFNFLFFVELIRIHICLVAWN